MGIRRVEKTDLKKISKMTGAEILTTLADTEDGEESVDPASLGEAESV